MRNYSAGIERKGIEKGILCSIQNLMETLNMSAEQAMAALKVEECNRDKYLEMLKKA